MPRYDITMKPTAMSKAKFRPEYEISLEVEDKNAAAMAARKTAQTEGFNGYAITKIKEVQQ